jgi:hypothetical protein
MKIFGFLIFGFLLLNSCSHESPIKNASITSIGLGIYQNSILPFPLFLTEKLDVSKAPPKSIIIHVGHFLKSNNSNEENLKTLGQMSEVGFHLVNLTLEDMAIVNEQKINLYNFPKLIFINSTVSDFSNEAMTFENEEYNKLKNVVPYYVLNDIAFIGLSDNRIDSSLNIDSLIINDYVYSILKVKREIKNQDIKSFILIHNMKDSMPDIMERIPPSFINSLAN